MTESGLDLAEAYYREVVAPLLDARWPRLPHAAARLGSGSDVLGLDDDTSRDHDWGLRLTLLLDGALVAPVDEYLERSLPPLFRGHPTRFSTTWHPRARHQIEVASADSFATSRLGVDVKEPLTAFDWLSLTGQSVLEVTAGAVFTDQDGRLGRIREALTWYPHDVWLYVLAADWSRLGQELPFIGRAGQRGDDLGSRIIASRLVHAAMHLGFLLERRWAPYGKWLGTLFARLPSAGTAAGALADALAATEWRAREYAVCSALDMLHELQRSIGLPTGETILEPFYTRPFRGLTSAPELLLSTVTDPDVAHLPAGVGSIEQWVDNVNVLTSRELRQTFTHALEARTGCSRPDR